jgi:hypothetical protein
MPDPIRLISLAVSNEVIDVSVLTEDEVTDALLMKFQPQMPGLLRTLGLPEDVPHATLIIERVKALDPTQNKIYVGWLLKQLKFKNIRIAILPNDAPEDEDRIKGALGLFEQAKAIPALKFNTVDNDIPAIAIPQVATLDVDGQQVPVIANPPKRLLKPFYPPQANGEQRQQILTAWQTDRQQWLAANTWNPNLRRLDPDINKYQTLGDLEALIDVIRGIEFKTKRSTEKARVIEMKKGVRELVESENYFILQCYTPAAAAHYAKMTKWCTSNEATAANYMNSHGGSLLIIFKKDGEKLEKYGQATADLQQIQNASDRALEMDDELKTLLGKVAEELIAKASTAYEVFGLINAGFLTKFNVKPDVVSGMMERVIASCEQQDPSEPFGFSSPIKMSEDQARRLYAVVASKQRPELANTTIKSPHAHTLQHPIGSPAALGVVLSSMMASLEDPDQIYALAMDSASKVGDIETLISTSTHVVKALLLNPNTPYTLTEVIYRFGLMPQDSEYGRDLHCKIAYDAVMHPTTPEEQKTPMLVHIWKTESASKKKKNNTNSLQTLIDMLSGPKSAKYLPRDMVYEFMAGVSHEKVQDLFNAADDKDRAFQSIIDGNNYSKRHALALTNIKSISDMSVADIINWADYARKNNLPVSIEGLQLMKGKKELNEKLAKKIRASPAVLSRLNPAVAERLKHLLQNPDA